MAEINKEIMDRVANLLAYEGEEGAYHQLIFQGMSGEDAFLSIQACKLARPQEESCSRCGGKLDSVGMCFDDCWDFPDSEGEDNA